MTLLLRGIAIFMILLLGTTLAVDIFQAEFGTVNFFQKRGVFFLIFITLFPRLTLLFSSVAFGGVLWWLGFIFFPRILVALLATVAYFHTNPVLVTISWLVALGGEALEKVGLSNRSKFVIRTYRSEAPSYGHKSLGSKDVIEAEFTKKSE
jgi:hypothetical protein